MASRSAHRTNKSKPARGNGFPAQRNGRGVARYYLLYEHLSGALNDGTIPAGARFAQRARAGHPLSSCRARPCVALWRVWRRKAGSSVAAAAAPSRARIASRRGCTWTCRPSSTTYRSWPPRRTCPILRFEFGNGAGVAARVAAAVGLDRVGHSARPSLPRLALRAHHRLCPRAHRAQDPPKSPGASLPSDRTGSDRGRAPQKPTTPPAPSRRTPSPRSASMLH